MGGLTIPVSGLAAESRLTIQGTSRESLLQGAAVAQFHAKFHRTTTPQATNEPTKPGVALPGVSMSPCNPLVDVFHLCAGAFSVISLDMESKTLSPQSNCRVCSAMEADPFRHGVLPPDEETETDRASFGLAL